MPGHSLRDAREFAEPCNSAITSLRGSDYSATCPSKCVDIDPKLPWSSFDNGKSPCNLRTVLEQLRNRTITESEEEIPVVVVDEQCGIEVISCHVLPED